MNRIGLICSGGGAVMAATYDILKGLSREPDWVIVTDRACETEQKANARGIPLRRVEYQNAEDFSSKAAHWLFDEMQCDCSILLFTRFVGEAVFDAKHCINLHPSLLPFFPGLGALRATQASGMRIMGATAHCVDQSTDGGPIVAQVWAPCPKDIKSIQRVSFAQKLYLLLLLQDSLTDGDIDAALNALQNISARSSAVAQPAIADAKLNTAFGAFLKSEDIPWPI